MGRGNYTGRPSRGRRARVERSRRARFGCRSPPWKPQVERPGDPRRRLTLTRSSPMKPYFFLLGAVALVTACDRRAGPGQTSARAVTGVLEVRLGAIAAPQRFDLRVDRTTAGFLPALRPLSGSGSLGPLGAGLVAVPVVRGRAGGGGDAQAGRRDPRGPRRRHDGGAHPDHLRQGSARVSQRVETLYRRLEQLRARVAGRHV